LPRTLGEHPDTGNRVFVNTGRFGPYVCHVKGNGDKDDNRSLKATDDPYTISFERALELLAQPKVLRGAAAAKVLKSLGKHPDDQEEIEILDGKYGAYVKHGKLNVSLTKEQTVEGLTVEEAVAMLAAKAKTARGTSKGAKASTTAKKSPKTAATKTTTKTAKAATTTTKTTATKASSKTAAKKSTTTKSTKSTKTTAG
jgi:DNA topoisomerase-1